MATEYTPATGDIRGVIEWRHRMARDRLTPEAFDRWLREHDAEVIEKALSELTKAIRLSLRFQMGYLPDEARTVAEVLGALVIERLRLEEG